MIRLRVTVTNPGAPALRAVADRVPDELGNLVGQVADKTEQALKDAAPVGKNLPDGREHGKLRDSIAFDLEGTSAVFTASQVAQYVIGGTVAHEIRPRGAHPLHFWWEHAGGFVNLMRVQHPGTKPNDFRQGALEEAAADTSELLDGFADSLFDGVG